MTDLPARLQLARSIALEAGQIACDMRKSRDADFIASKGHQDFVTKADKAVEAHLRTRILAAFPEDGFWGEEGGQSSKGAVTWVVDPIDGTTNYMRGLPEWGVSIACVQDDQVLHGVVALPDLSRLAWASAGLGAYLDDTLLDLSRSPVPNANLSAPSNIANSLGILGHSDRLDRADHLETIERLLAQGCEYRRQGAACFGLVAVAAGWVDFYFEGHLNAWDALAGLLLVQEAKGSTLSAPIPEFLAQGSAILASGCDAATLAAIKSCLPQALLDQSPQQQGNA